MLRTSCSGLGTQATPKASLQQLKKTRMAVSQSKLQLKRKKCLLCLTATFAARTFHFFSTASVPAFVMACVPRTLHSFVPQSFHSLHNLCLHGLMAALFFCGGKAVAAMPLVRARLVPRRLPPLAPVRLRGRACNFTAKSPDRSSSVIKVCGMKCRLALAAP